MSIWYLSPEFPDKMGKLKNRPRFAPTQINGSAQPLDMLLQIKYLDIKVKNWEGR
jgi:hypothetical protein